MTRSRAAKADHVGMGLYEVTVSAVRTLSPRLVRITLAGASLHGFRDDGPDQRCKLLLPRPGQDRPVPLEADRWYEHWQSLPADIRPVMRTYTVRHSRPELGEIDLDVVLHSPAGPASAWAAQARPGQRAAVFGAWAEYEPAPDADWQLIVGDHSALPAIAAILEQLPATAPARVVIEVPDASDRLRLAREVTWVSGSGLLAAVTALPWPAGDGYAWVAGERGVVRQLRRHLVHDRGLAPDRVMFMGYWRTGGPL